MALIRPIPTSGGSYTPVSITAKTSGFYGFTSDSDLSMYNRAIVAYSDNGNTTPTSVDSATNCNATIIASHVNSNLSSIKRVIIFELTNITGAVTVQIENGVGSWTANATGAGVN